jgi:hypothetical protein
LAWVARGSEPTRGGVAGGGPPLGLQRPHRASNGRGSATRESS